MERKTIGGLYDTSRISGYERGVLKGMARTIMSSRIDSCVVCRVDKSEKMKTILTDRQTDRQTDRVLCRTVIGGIYPNASERYQRPPLKGLINCIKTDADRSAGYVAKIYRDKASN